MSTKRKDQGLRGRLSAARFAIVTLLGALEKVRDLLADGYVAEAKAAAETALLDADTYLKLVDGPSTGNGNGDGEPR